MEASIFEPILGPFREQIWSLIRKKIDVKSELENDAKTAAKKIGFWVVRRPATGRGPGPGEPKKTVIPSLGFFFD